jgi:hypothetical protein
MTAGFFVTNPRKNLRMKAEVLESENPPGI